MHETETQKLINMVNAATKHFRKKYDKFEINIKKSSRKSPKHILK